MKTLIVRITAALLLAGILQGCAATVQQESALEWMARQPWMSDGPN